AWSETVHEAPVAGTAKAIASNPAALGFGGFEDGGPGLKALAVARDAHSPAIEGTGETAASGRYPLTRYMYIRLQRKPGEAVPATPTNKPQTEEQAEHGRQKGRELPPPEVLQPTLDAQLPAYQPRRDIQISGTLKGASSDVLTVLAQKWMDKFKTYYPNASLSIAPPYAGSLGAIELIKGDLDFVFVSRELKPDDIKQFKAKFGYDPLSVPISGGSYRHFGALDAVAFFVNKDNPIESITYKQLDQMYSTTHARGGAAITKWGDLGLTGEWADKPVHLYGIKPWNGFEEFVRQRVLSSGGKRGEWRDDIR